MRHGYYHHELHQLYTIIIDGDETTLVEVTDGTLVGFLADAKLLLDFLSTTLVP